MIVNKKTLDIRPVAGSIGAEIYDVDLSSRLDNEVFAEIHKAFLKHLVLFFPGQKVLKPDQLRTFAAHFGEIDTAPFVYPFKMPSLEGFPEIYNIIKEADNILDLGPLAGEKGGEIMKNQL